MSATERKRNAQRQIQLAAYESKQAGENLHRIDDVMDVGGWNRSEVEAVVRQLEKATELAREAVRVMYASGVPVGFSR